MSSVHQHHDLSTVAYRRCAAEYYLGRDQLENISWRAQPHSLHFRRDGRIPYMVCILPQADFRWDTYNLHYVFSWRSIRICMLAHLSSCVWIGLVSNLVVLCIFLFPDVRMTASETNLGNMTGTDLENTQANGEGEAGGQLDQLEVDEVDEVDDVDNTTWDGDSALGSMSLFSSTQSLNSSIYNHVVENGRTYHRFKEGKYLLPNDENEQKRLDYQHQLYTAVLNGKLYISPIGEQLRNVLDVGTGTGIWAVEVGLEHPAATVTGIDLSPIQPSYAPPNVNFEICDAEDEWSFRQPFDLIHMRAMVTCFKNPRAVLAEAYRSLAPGGFIELRDPILPFQFLTPPPEDSALKLWCDKLMEAARLAGRKWDVATLYAQMLGELGFVNVTERREAIARK
ncbi:S-adenosyl-L-methionine-dependent methyltransferase [Xylaria curta]|nr:S-adenosyl-L-methionine-dependent methyltransferase [Xylaria curta]